MRTYLLALALIVLPATLVVPLEAVASTTTTEEAANEQRFLYLLNRERTSRGKPALKVSTKLRRIAREWSDKMLAQGSISHRPNLANQVDTRVTTRWTRLGENVGKGGGVDSLNKAFMDSSSHRANILGDYNYVGIGVQRTASGTIYVTVDFVKSSVALS